MIPFTVVKTRMESGAFQYRSVGSALGSILRTEGARGLARGLGPTLARDVPFSGLYLAFYDLLKAEVTVLSFSFTSSITCPQTPSWVAASSPAAAHMTAGLGAGILASLVTQPADVVKTRLQLGQASSVTAAVTSLYREAGLAGFASGLAPRMLRRSVMAALAWTLYERLTKSLKLK
jgi:solute carrier family 25 protein 38